MEADDVLSFVLGLNQKRNVFYFPHFLMSEKLMKNELKSLVELLLVVFHRLNLFPVVSIKI